MAISGRREYGRHKLLADRAEWIRPRMDVINARLDYAQTNDEKRKLLTDLIGEYDKLIQLAEAAARAPVRPPSPGQRRPSTHVRALS
jgi:hypothetical protein